MSGTRINTVSTAGLTGRRGVTESGAAERALTARRNFTDPPRMRVARISETTATYDFQGHYPTRKLFQVSKPVPERAAYGTLVSDIPSASAEHLFRSSYLRPSSMEPQYIDSLQ